MTKILALIDADALTYQSSKDSLEESILTLNEKIQNIYEKTQCTHAAFFISKGKYFRHSISSDYKLSRGKYPTKLLWLKTLKAYLEENYQANSMHSCEADDLIALNYNRNFIYLKESDQVCAKEDCANINMLANSEEVKVIISSPDKDLLQSIEGEHFNYTYKLEDKSNPDSIIKGWWVETSLLSAYDFIWKQVLMGDAADNVQGLNKIGEKTAFKWINECKEGYASFVLNKYIDHYQDESKAIFEFQKNYRLLHLLSTNEDFEREIGQIPQLPKIIELNKITTNNDNSDGIDELFK